MAELACFSYVTIRRSNGQIPTLGGNFDYAGIEYIDLVFYGGDPFVQINNAADLTAAFAALGYTVNVAGTRIYFIDPDLPFTPQDVPAVLEVRVNVLVGGIPAQAGNTIDYTLFDYVDLGFYGGGTVEVTSNSQLVTAFAALGISASVVSPGVVRLNGYRLSGAPYSDIHGYSHSSVVLTGIPVCPGGTINYALFDCVDFSPIPGGTKQEIQSESALLAELAQLTGKTVIADGCGFKIKYGTASYSLPVSAFVTATLVDTDEGITNICVGGAFDYNKFDTIDLTPYGGHIVEVNSNQDIIDEFAALGIPVSIGACQITMEACSVTQAVNIEVGKWATVNLIDTDEGITTCIAPNFAYSAFDSIDLTYYGGGADVEVNSNSDLIAAFAAIGHTVTVNNCKISIQGMLPGQGQDIEVCRWDTIKVVESGGANLCQGGTIDWAVVNSLDLTFYGGGPMEVITSSAQLQTRLQQLGWPNTIVNGCEHKIQMCVNTQDIVANINAPVMEINMSFNPDEDGEFVMTLGAYIPKNNTKIALTNGDRIRVVIPQENVDVELIVGGSPDTAGSGYTNDVGLRWQTRIVPYLEAVTVMDAISLAGLGYGLTFRKKRWAIGRNYTYDVINNVDRAIALEWRFWAKDVSANNTSAMVSGIMEPVVALLSAFGDMNCAATKHDSFVSGHTSIDVVNQYTRVINGNVVVMNPQAIQYVNGVERQYFTGNYAPGGPSVTAIAESLFFKKSGLRGLIKGGFNSDGEFHFDFPCFTGQDIVNCSAGPYGEHLLSNYPTSFDVQAQYLRESPFIGSTPVFNTNIVIDNATTYPVTYTAIGSGRYISSIVTLTLTLNQVRRIRAEGTEPVFGVGAVSSADIKLVKLY